MKIENVKINGIKNPVGYAMETPVVSWCVTECLGGYQTSVRIDVSPDEDFSEIILQNPVRTCHAQVQNLNLSLNLVQDIICA